MRRLPDGAYWYYPSEGSAYRILCEVSIGYVAEVGEEGWRPIDAYPGRFVPLVEAPEVQAIDTPLDIDTK